MKEVILLLDTTIDYKMIGTRIKKRRNELKLTQEQLASKLGISIFYLSKIENGKAHVTLDMLSLISHQLGVDLSVLITGTSTLEKSYYVSELEEIYNKANKKQMGLIIKLAKSVIDE